MSGNNILRLLARIILAAGAVMFLPSAVEAQAARKTKEPPKPPSSAVFTQAMARAWESGRPLIVFGTTEGCSRCAALKQALATQSDLKLLMTQYISAEVQFGGRDFVAIWDDAVRQNANFGQSIGAPAVFMFTAKGEAVFAGPKSSNGMPPGDEFKKLLILGIEKNGGLRGTVKPSAASLAADVAKASKLLSDNQVLAAAATLSKHVSSDEPTGNAADDMAALADLTGLKLAKSKTEEQLDSLVLQVSKKGLSLVEAAIATSTGDATRGAVQLAELERTFRGYPLFEGQFESAWKELLAKSNAPNLKEQAELVDKARQAETGADQAQAIVAYELVCATYPDTKVAELSQLRIRQLRTAKKAASRLWKSKVGQFSVTATLLAFDGKSAQLQTAEGKTITVAFDALSEEDQQFLKETKPQN